MLLSRGLRRSRGRQHSPLRSKPFLRLRHAADSERRRSVLISAPPVKSRQSPSNSPSNWAGRRRPPPSNPSNFESSPAPPPPYFGPHARRFVRRRGRRAPRQIRQFPSKHGPPSRPYSPPLAVYSVLTAVRREAPPQRSRARVGDDRVKRGLVPSSSTAGPSCSSHYTL
jgi:hypothetical protein